MASLVVLVPSYNRPDNAWRLLKAFADTCVETPSLVFAVDEEDKTSWLYPPSNTVLTPGRGMVNALNYWAPRLVEDPEVEAIAFMGDDHLPRTHSWDRNYLKALRTMKTGFVYGNDLLQGEIMPTQIAMTADIVRKLGWMSPPAFQHLCVDLAWKDMGDAIGKIRYLDTTIIEHLHPANGKAELDAGYQRVNAPEVVTKDAEEYYRWKAEDLPGIIEKLRELL